MHGGWWVLAVATIAAVGVLLHTSMRMSDARRTDADVSEARNNALRDSLPIAGATVVGVVLGVMLVAAAGFFFLLWVAGTVVTNGHAGGGFGLAIALLLFGAVLMLLGLPTAAIVYVVRRRRRA